MTKRRSRIALLSAMLAFQLANAVVSFDRPWWMTTMHVVVGLLTAYVLWDVVVQEPKRPQAP